MPTSMFQNFSTAIPNCQIKKTFASDLMLFYQRSEKGQCLEIIIFNHFVKQVESLIINALIKEQLLLESVAKFQSNVKYTQSSEILIVEQA